MPDCFLLSRVLLHFQQTTQDIITDLSAVTLTPDGSMWLGSDELITLEKLSPIESCNYGKHEQFAIADFINLSNLEDEIDIEGIDYSHHYLWITGSHSTKRKKAKGKDAIKDMFRLSQVIDEPNRYLIARIPVVDGNLFKSCPHPENPQITLTASCLKKTKDNKNILIEALREDEHFGAYIKAGIPSKENGFDIEGLAVYNDKIFLGLRGPVLRGWAIILELQLTEAEPGILTLKEIGLNGRKYRKHFLDLNGLGVRELCLNGEDLIVLAGPTMTLEGAMRIFRLKNVLELVGDTLCGQDSGRLEVLFDLPFKFGTDHAEGLALFPGLGEPDSLLVVYDSPDPARIIAQQNAVFADVFRLCYNH